jgi:SAM-dependent methyltransferase
MQPVVDNGKNIDWGLTSPDYARYRPGPPDELYTRLQALGVGLPGQRVLDLGTGTGVVARALAERGAIVAATDISPAQIEAARRLAAREGLAIDFRVAPAEEPPFAEHQFDVATANQCFLYFDKARTIAALKRVLVAGGRLVASHFSWLPEVDAIAAASEALVLKFNPNWQAAGYDGRVTPMPAWVPPDIVLEGFFIFDVDVPFTHEAWRGRIRASRGVGAALSADQVTAFDQEHAALLAAIAPPEFSIKHRVGAHILRFP